MKAYELLADPAMWCKGALYKLKSGEVIKDNFQGDPPPLEDVAACCLAGALYICHPLDIENVTAFDKVQAAIEERGFDLLSRWNDDPGTTHADVIALAKQCDL